MTSAEGRYTKDAYATDNPGWHEADAEWKARRVIDALRHVDIRPSTICDIDCGTGGVLEHIGERLPGVETLVGYEISQQAVDLAPVTRRSRVEFALDAASDDRRYDVALVLDVIEHTEDYLGFLRSCGDRAEHFVFHIPLDLTVVATLRPAQYGRLRSLAGHLHYFTPGIARARCHGVHRRPPRADERGN